MTWGRGCRVLMGRGLQGDRGHGWGEVCSLDCDTRTEQDIDMACTTILVVWSLFVVPAIVHKLTAC